MCYAGQHLVLTIVLGVLGVVFFSVGVPVASWLHLRRHLADIDDATDAHGFRARYGFLYTDYDRPFYFWESIIMLR